MEINNSQGAGSTPDTSGGIANLDLNRSKDEIIKFESFDKLVGQLKRSKELNEELNNKIGTFESEKKEIEEAKLAEQGEFKKLLELRATEMDTLREELKTEKTGRNKADKTLIDAQKLQAVFEELPGRLKNPEYMQFIDLEKVAYNPETGDVDRESAKLSANKFADKHSFLIDTSHVGQLPSNSSSVNTPLTTEMFKTLSVSERRKRLSELE
jgi:predicted nuclease with TOPRIM domain